MNVVVPRPVELATFLRAQVRHRTITVPPHSDQIHTRMGRILSGYPGSGPDSPAAHWQDYFPARHEVSDQCFRLTASYVDTYSFGTTQWRAEDLLSE